MNIEITKFETYSSLTLGIPSDRDISWTLRILSQLKKPEVQVKVLISRWIEKRLTSEELQLLNTYFPTQQLLSQARHAPAMRNLIVNSTQSSHLLFLDDDMVPDPDLLDNAFLIAASEPNVVHQGTPYLVANSDNWLARTEGKLYEKSFRRYLGKDKEVDLLDARVMLAPVEVLRETPFNESMVFGGGEGHELAIRLRERGIALRLAPDLSAAHINRETIAALIAQKRAHGRGRGYMLLQDGPGENGWSGYIKTYLHRHLKEPAINWTRGELDIKELMYVWGTYTVLWLGVLEEMARSKMKPKS